MFFFSWFRAESSYFTLTGWGGRRGIPGGRSKGQGAGRREVKLGKGVWHGTGELNRAGFVGKETGGTVKIHCEGSSNNVHRSS